MLVIRSLEILAEVRRQDDGTYLAELPEVDDTEVEGATSRDAIEKLTELVMFRLRNW